MRGVGGVDGRRCVVVRSCDQQGLRNGALRFATEIWLGWRHFFRGVGWAVCILWPVDILDVFFLCLMAKF